MSMGTALGKDEAQLGHSAEIVAERTGKAGHIVGKLRQNALDLLILPGSQHPQLIVGLDHLHGLDVDRLTGGADVMHQTADGGFHLRLHGHHIPVAAHGDQALLQDLGIGGRGDDLMQYLPDAGVGAAHLPSDGGQLRRGGICDLILAENTGGDLFV